MLSNIIQVCVIVLVVNTILLFVLLRLSCHHQRENFLADMQSDVPTIPKIIWTYWNDGVDSAPKLIKQCIKTWETHNKDYDIRIITQDNYRKFIPNVDILKLKHADSQQRIADFIRCHVLANYGGVWCDASIAMTKSLSWIQRKHVDFVGYYLESFTSKAEYPVIESWFFACRPKTKFITLWRDELMRLNDFENVSDYVKDIESNTIVDKIAMKEYLAIHLAAQKVLQHYLSKSDMANLALFKAEDGPLLYLVNGDWESEKALKYLCETNARETPLVKFRSLERSLLESKIELNDCIEKRLFRKIKKSV
jgi:hypothetical protein